MSWRRFAPGEYTKAHVKLCWGKGGLTDHGVPFLTEYVIDCGEDGQFKVDIYIAHNLVVEVDGASHQREDRRNKDLWKDSVLRKHGYAVLRFQEQEINKCLAKVVAACLAAINK